MIEFRDFSLTYADAQAPVLRNVDLSIREGTLCLVTGATGSGKTSLLRAINGLVPHFTGGTVAGSVVVGGRDTRTTEPAAMADLVGYVAQDPARGFVAETVEYELAYGMEQTGVPQTTMRSRVEEVLDLVGISSLRDRKLMELSGGEQQRVAIGSVLTAQPRVLVLDEPTSALDPGAAEDVLATMTRLVHDLGLTVVVAEHRLERIVQYVDQVVMIDDGEVVLGDPRSIMENSPLVPPVVEMGRELGWSPVPLSVREARDHAASLRLDVDPIESAAPEPGVVAISASDLEVRYGSVVAVNEMSFEARRGETCVVMGRNGSGKSSLLWALQGAMAPTSGTVVREGPVGLVPQTPGDLLFRPSVSAECRQADDDWDKPPGSCSALLGTLVAGIDEETHPADLSEGQRLALAMATQLVADPEAMLLDEPTRGLDYRAKATLAESLHRLAEAGSAVVLSTHDVEFAAQVADRVVVLAQGEVVNEGTAVEVLTGTPLFSPQVAKVMAPVPMLTLSDVLEARG